MDEARISCDWCSSEALNQLLQAELPSRDVQLELRRSPHVFRSPTLDPTVLVAIVAGSSSAVAALINGLFRILEQRGKEQTKIVLRGADGTTIEAPASTTPQELEKLVELALRLEKPLIRLTDGSPRRTS